MWLFIKYLSLWFWGFFCGVAAIMWVASSARGKEKKELLKVLKSESFNMRRFALVCLLFLALIMLAGCAKTMPPTMAQTTCPPVLRCKIYQQMNERELADYRTAVEMCSYQEDKK